VTLLADLEKFVAGDRPHGTLTADATEPDWNGLPAHGGMPVWGGI